MVAIFTDGSPRTLSNELTPPEVPGRQLDREWDACFDGVSVSRPDARRADHLLHGSVIDFHLGQVSELLTGVLERLMS